jgi:hypothetical protein
MTWTKFDADWAATARWLSESGPDRGVHQLYPDASVRLSLLAALGSRQIPVERAEREQAARLKERLEGLTQQLHALHAVGNCPVVGVAGLLNSGKSSLVATYLSPEGRQRVLRGAANSQGTHRFVLWLPSAWWSQPDLLHALRDQLTTLFSVPPEELSNDAAEAYRQYNGELLGSVPAAADPLSVPLLAHDPGLDQLGLGLLDCPDIQSAFWAQSFHGSRPDSAPDRALLTRQVSGQDSEQASGLHLGQVSKQDTGQMAGPDSGPASGSQSEFNRGPAGSTHRYTSRSEDAEEIQQRRRAHLARIGRLCSAFVVVSKFGSLGEQRLLDILETLRDTMPGVPRILAVNKVKARYAPEVVYAESRPLVERYQMQAVYLAYDFRSHWAEQRLPPTPASMSLEAGEALPVFFQPGEAHASPKYLHQLADLLQPGTLVVEGRRSILGQMEAGAAQAVAWVENCQHSRARQLTHAWQAIADACFEFMAQRDASDRAIGLRLQTSPAIVSQMSDSLCRAAPWSMRLSLAVDRSVRNLQHSIADSASKFAWLRSAAGGISQFVGRFRQGETGKVVNADRFARQLTSCDHRGALQALPTELLVERCETALTRFKLENTVRLDPEWLDQWAAETWKHMPMKRKLYVGALPLAPVFGPLLAVTFIPFDAGGTAVLVFATTKELLAAAGIAAMATPVLSGNQVTDLVEREAAWSQLGELFAVTCDSIGIPRPEPQEMPGVSLGGQQRALTASQLPLKLPSSEALAHLWQLAPHFADTLSRQFVNLGRELSSASLS